MSKAKHKTSTEKVSHPFQAAFRKTAAARAALAASDLLPINLDVQIALTSVLGAVPRLMTFRDAIVAALPDLDITQLDHLKTFAEALAFANAAYLAASRPLETLPALQSRAMEIRDQLLSDATALAKRGLLDRKLLSELKGGTGYLNTSSDLGVLVRMLRERWDAIASKSAIQLAELDEAEQLFERITSAYAERTQQSTAVAAAAEDRQRAYSLLLRAYDQARRAMTYLRWREDDVEKIAPSLWAGRGQRSGNAGTANAGSTANGAAPSPDAATGSASVGAEPNGTIPAHALTPAPPIVIPALPGGSSFSTNGVT
jgi:hypothetical protein